MLINAFPSDGRGGGYLNHVEITTSTTWTVPENVKEIFVQVFGGGGSGGGGGGGGGGYMNFGVFTVTPGTSYAITIGAGGSGSATYYGQNGGKTSFGELLSADGGQHGDDYIGGSGGTGGGRGNVFDSETNQDTGYTRYCYAGDAQYGGAGGGGGRYQSYVYHGRGGIYGGSSNSEFKASPGVTLTSAGENGVNAYIFYKDAQYAKYLGKATTNGAGGGWGGNAGKGAYGGGGGYLANGGDDNGINSSTATRGGGGGGWMGGDGGDGGKNGSGGGGGYGPLKLATDGRYDGGGKGGLGYGAGGGGCMGNGAPGICIIEY